MCCPPHAGYFDLARTSHIPEIDIIYEVPVIGDRILVNQEKIHVIMISCSRG
jgi:hypothetical protein